MHLSQLELIELTALTATKAYDLRKLAEQYEEFASDTSEYISEHIPFFRETAKKYREEEAQMKAIRAKLSKAYWDGLRD